LNAFRLSLMPQVKGGTLYLLRVADNMNIGEPLG
jgi:hypothetical protein